MAEQQAIRKIMVTGATGFVGRYVVRELLARGFTPVCVVRNAERLRAQHGDVDPERIITIVGSLEDRDALIQAANQSDSVIHLVGIIIGRRLKGQSFEGVHVRGTANVLNAAEDAGILRYIHMSALGSRRRAVSRYHQTKWEAEEDVRRRDLDWTIFRPSLIHGPDGEFMRLVKSFVCGLNPPVIPYFGSGQAKLQPVSVKDVAHCFVEALVRDEAVGQTYPLGGPAAYTWLELYGTCRRILPGARRWKPYASLPPALAKLVAIASAPPMALAELVVPAVGMFRFDGGQVQMALEDNVCDPATAERAFGIKMRDFEEELTEYAERIR